MTVQTYTPGGLIAGDFPQASRTVTITGGVALQAGAVLGRITSGGAYQLSVAGAVDGSEAPIAVLLLDADASSADVEAPVLFAGEVDASKLSFGTGHTATTVDAAWATSGQPLFARTLV